MDMATSCDGVTCPDDQQAALVNAANAAVSRTALDEQVLQAPQAIMRFMLGHEALRQRAMLAEVGATCVSLAHEDAGGEG